MRSVKLLSMLLIVISFIMIGCNKTSTKTNVNVESELQQLRSENEKLKENLNSSVKSIETLENEKNISRNMVDDKDYCWVKEEEWDKIIIYKSNRPEKKVEIKEKVFLKNIYFENLMMFKDSYPNGPQSDVEYYTYEFTKGDKTYRVNVVGRDEIEYEGKYFLTNKYVYNLGKALLPQSKFISTDSILNKIYESGALHGDKQFKYLSLSSFRIHGLANALQDGIEEGVVSVISTPLTNAGETKENFSFYYYGQNIYMDVYHNYLCIRDGSKSYWYKIESENLILTVLSAG